MAACAFHVGGFMKNLVAQRQRLVAAEHQRARSALADLGRLSLGEDRGDILGGDTAVLQGRLERALVDVRRHRLNVEPGVDEHRLAKRAARSEDDFLGHDIRQLAPFVGPTGWAFCRRPRFHRWSGGPAQTLEISRSPLPRRHPRAKQERSSVAKTLGIHAVTSAEGRSGAEFYTVAILRRHGMDPRVYAASLRSLLRPRMTKRWASPPISKACDPS
ncbi:hypothetical protein MPLB_1290019 [Mesorhizobium sp. ORS 3324]|nr:hypothetical protein MPLB_1290019 [Mesorhizobium sp. ORS 3324]